MSVISVARFYPEWLMLPLKEELVENINVSFKKALARTRRSYAVGISNYNYYCIRCLLDNLNKFYLYEAPMLLKDKIADVRNELPLPSEVATDEIICTVKYRRIIRNIKPLYPRMLLPCIIQLTFKKEYVADVAIGWNLVKWEHSQ